MLVRLIYASRAVSEVNAALLESILGSSRAHNPQAGITGVLCFSGGVFVQVLEGGRDAVSSLYHTIVHDPRHAQLELLQFEEITERHFSAWTMGQVNLDNINASTLLRYSPKAQFDPFSMSGGNVLLLLDELMATAAIRK